MLNEDDLNSPSKAVISGALAKRIAGADNGQTLIGTQIPLGDTEAEVVGVLSGDEDDESLVVYVPFTFNSYEPSPQTLPTLVVKAHSVEDVNPVKESIETWLDENKAGGQKAFSIFTYQARVAQMEQGVRVFKLIMGLITGIAVLVGGIGVMNVLLISITERTREIGIRKATGARKRDIVLQFLTEAIAVSILGSLFGVVLGLVFMAVALPVIKNLTEAPPFEIAFSVQS